MVSVTLSEILVGIYLGLLAGIFPAFIAFSIGFGFKYFTNVTVPGLGVVVLGGALAGVSGGLMGLVDPQLGEGWTGITAVLVILMACLWAHSQGDKLGTATPRKFTLKTLRENRLSTDLVDRMDSYGQIRIQPIGAIADIEGYPPLSEELREQLYTSSWKFPGNLALSELEHRLEERLVTDHELADVSVSIDKQGRAQIAAAPSGAGLSRRLPPGKRAVSIQTLLPTGVARGDSVTIDLPNGSITGPVVSARTTASKTETAPSPDGVPKDTAGDEKTDDETATPPLPPTTTGGEGQITIAVSNVEAQRIIRSSVAPIVVRSRGKQREYEAIGVLKANGNRFRKVAIGQESSLVGSTIGTAQVRDRYGVAILAIRRLTERIVGPSGTTTLQAGDVLIVVGKPNAVRSFTEVAE